MDIDNSKEYIEIFEEDGTLNKYELITTIKSDRDNKIYYIMTANEEIGEEIDYFVGYVLEDDEDYNITMVDDDNELDYVEMLIDREVGE